MSRLTTNIVSLFLIQGANYVLPLITIPYLVRILGVSGFGSLAYAAAIAQIFVVLTEFGFNLTATREIAIHRESADKLNAIISGVYVLKGCLLVISSLLLCLIIFGLSGGADSKIYWASFLLAVGNFMFPGWLFQGLEKMPFVTFTNIAAKVLCVAGIFLFVKSSDDIVLAAVLQSVGNVIAGIFGLLLMPRIFSRFKVVLPSFAILKKLIYDGRFVFASQISALFVNGSHTLILGYFIGAGSVGNYAIAEKIIKAANNAQSPICNAIYPRSSALFSQSHELGISFLRKVFFWVFPTMFLGCLVVAIFANEIIFLISGSVNSEATLILRILSFIPCSVFLDNFLGTQILLNSGRSRQFMSAILISGLLGVIAALVFVPIFGAIASAFAYFGAQLCVLLLMAWYVYRAGLLATKVIS